MTTDLRIECFEDLDQPGQWRVEVYMDFFDEDPMVSLFCGRFAEMRAKSYAGFVQERIATFDCAGK